MTLNVRFPPIPAIRSLVAAFTQNGHYGEFQTGTKKGRHLRAAPSTSLSRDFPELAYYQPKVKPTRPAVLPCLLKPVATPAFTATLWLTRAPICNAPA